MIRVWRKVTDNTPKTRLIPNSSNDVTVGFATVDLSVLMAGLPTISGWFNIIDHSGCINGQIKVRNQLSTDCFFDCKRYFFYRRQSQIFFLNLKFIFFYFRFTLNPKMT